MQAELDALEQKLAQLLELSQRLRAENHRLRQDLVSALSSKRQFEDKITAAQARLEHLLTQLPEDQS